MGVTAFLIHEMPQDTNRFSVYGEDFLSDGIIHMDLRRDENNVNLFLGIAKMRAAHHKRGYSPVIYDKNGFELVTD